MLDVGERPGHPQGDHGLPGREHVGTTRCAPGAGEVCDDVVGRARRAVVVHGADGDDVRVDRGHRQAVRRRAAVSGGGHHDDPAVPGVLHRPGKRVDLPGLDRVRAVGQVEDPHVHPGVVTVLDHPVDGRDHLGHVGPAVTGGDLHVQQLGLGRDACEQEGRGLLAVEALVLAGDDACQVGAVPEAVDVAGALGLALVGEVGTLHHLVVVGGQARHRGDTGVDERHRHAVPGRSSSPGALGAAGGGQREHRTVVERGVPRAALPSGLALLALVVTPQRVDRVAVDVGLRGLLVLGLVLGLGLRRWNPHEGGGHHGGRHAPRPRSHVCSFSVLPRCSRCGVSHRQQDRRGRTRERPQVGCTTAPCGCGTVARWPPTPPSSARR